jgi:hypothetical protein
LQHLGNLAQLVALHEEGEHATLCRRHRFELRSEGRDD